MSHVRTQSGAQGALYRPYHRKRGTYTVQAVGARIGGQSYMVAQEEAQARAQQDAFKWGIDNGIGWEHRQGTKEGNGGRNAYF